MLKKLPTLAHSCKLNNYLNKKNVKPAAIDCFFPYFVELIINKIVKSVVIKKKKKTESRVLVKHC